MISFNNLKENYYLRNYQPLRLQGEENPYFDDWSENTRIKKSNSKCCRFWCDELEQH
jgi:hypothetical protein